MQGIVNSWQKDYGAQKDHFHQQDSAHQWLPYSEIENGIMSTHNDIHHAKGVHCLFMC